MFEPDIVWHYYGRLRRHVQNAACPGLVPAAVSGARVVLVPAVALNVVRDLVRASDLPVPVVCDSGDAKNLRHRLRTSSERLIWLPRPDDPDPVRACAGLAHVVRKSGESVLVLPRPSLTGREVLRLAEQAPSALLDGSFPLEQKLPEYLAEFPEPFGRMLTGAWAELCGTSDTTLLSRDVFEKRLTLLHPSVVEAPVWRAVLDLWRHILSRMREELARADRWKREVQSRVDGQFGWDDLDLRGYEQAIFASHALKDPRCLPYAAIVHGHYWLMGRGAALTFFGRFGGTAGSAFESTL